MSHNKDSGLISLTNLNLNGCIKLRVTAYANSSNNKNSNANGSANIYEFQAFGTMDAPMITTQPINQRINVGKQASISITATGSPKLVYQWFLNGKPLPDQTNSLLNISSVTTSNAGFYSVLVTNYYGSALSSNALLTVLESPAIISQPESLTVSASAPARFKVNVAGTEPYYYQWFFNGKELAGQNESELILPAALAADAGEYYVKISNEVGSVESTHAQLIIKIPEIDISGLIDFIAIHGIPIQFYLTASNLFGPIFFEMHYVSSGSYGTVAFNANDKPEKALFTYIPSEKDLTPFDLFFSASATNGPSVTKIITITPYAALIPESQIIESQLPLPSKQSLDYVVRQQRIEPTGKIFNGEVRKTRHIEVTAIDLIIAKGHENGFYDALNVPGGVRDVESVKIFAERVEIRDVLSLPNTTVNIFTPLFVNSGGGIIDAQAVSIVNDPSQWFTPQVLRLCLGYVRDLYLRGRRSEALSAISHYSGLLEKTTQVVSSNSGTNSAISLNPEIIKDNNEYQQLLAEMSSMTLHLVRHFDYFGNPAGWVPSLSFEVNLGLYSSEIDEAIKSWYLGYWMQNVADTVQSKINALRSSQLITFNTITEQQDELDALKVRVPQLYIESTNIVLEINNLQLRLQQRVDELNRQAEESAKAAKKKNQWRQVLSGVGSILQVVPVVQPVLGAVGSGMQFVAKVNSESFSSVQNIITTFQDVGNVVQQFSKVKWNNILGNTSDYLSNIKNKLDPSSILPPVLPTDPNFKAYTEKVKTYANSAGDVFKDIKETINKISEASKLLEIPYQDASALLAKAKAETPELNANIQTSDGVIRGILDEIENKFEEQKLISQQIDECLTRMSALKDTIYRNIIALDAINQDIGNATGVISTRVMVFAKDLQVRARERLLKYHYYLAKSFEMRFLEPYNEELDLQYFFDQIIRLAQADPSGNGQITRSNLDLLKTLYSEQIANIAKRIVDRFNQSGSGSRISRSYRFSSQELDKLNRGDSVILNFVDQLLVPMDREALEINNVHLEIGVSGKTNANDIVNLKIVHEGEAKMRRNENIFLLRYGSTSPFNPLQRTHPFQWEIEYDVNTGKMYESQPSLGDDSLIKFLLNLRNIPITTTNLLLFARPGLWADLNVRRADSQRILDNYKLTSVMVVIDYDYQRQNVSLANLNVATKPEKFLAPMIVVDKEDLAGRKHGIEKMHRIYGRNTSVTLSTPAHIGSWEFSHWSDAEGTIISTNNILNTILSENKAIRIVYSNTDTDGHGLPDKWQILYFGHLEQSPDADPDEDGLTNLRELIEGTNPMSKDTDNDGFYDRFEILHHTDPIFNNSRPSMLENMGALTLYRIDDGSLKLRWAGPQTGFSVLLQSWGGTKGSWETVVRTTNSWIDYSFFPDRQSSFFRIVLDQK